MKVLGIFNIKFLTNKGKVAKPFHETVLWLENGKKFKYREQEFIDKENITYLKVMPVSSRKIIQVLNYLKAEPSCLQEDQNLNRKTLILTVNLNKKQQEELNRLKSLCK